MTDKKLVNLINEHIQENFWLYMITLLFFFIGIVIGIYTVKYMGNFEKSDLGNYLTSFIDSIRQNTLDNRQVFFQALKNNIPIIFLIWILGLTIIGIPIILMANLVKGFTIGFTTSFLINGMGVKGIWVALIGVLPQNLIYFPCIIIASVISIEYSLRILKNKINKQHNASSSITYSINYLIIILIMTLGFLVEAYFTPNLIRYIVLSSGSVI